MTEIYEVRIVSRARKHGISRRRIERVLQSHDVVDTTSTETTDPKIRFVGKIDRGEEIEIVAVVLPGMLVIIHAMPTQYRRDQR